MRYHEGMHHGGFVLLGWLLPLVLLLAFAALLVWAVRRATPVAGATPAAPLAGSRPDTALETARVRYAKGEIDRDEYTRIVVDLGGQAPPATS